MHGNVMSDCALDHARVVTSLTPALLNRRFPLACVEKWAGRNTGGGAHDHGDGRRGGTAPLASLLCPDDACVHCGDEGVQWFSFCLNRAVCDDRVRHWCATHRWAGWNQR